MSYPRIASLSVCARRRKIFRASLAAGEMRRPCRGVRPQLVWSRRFCLVRGFGASCPVEASDRSNCALAAEQELLLATGESTRRGETSAQFKLAEHRFDCKEN